MLNINLNYKGTQIKVLFFKYWAHSKQPKMIFFIEIRGVTVI